MKTRPFKVPFTKSGAKTSLEKLIEKHNQEVVSLEQLQQELKMKLAESKAKLEKAKAKEKELYHLWLCN